MSSPKKTTAAASSADHSLPSEQAIQILTAQLTETREILATKEAELSATREQLEGKEKALAEALAIIDEQQAALSNVAPASESSSRVVKHEKKNYAFEITVFNLGGEIVRAEDATASQIAHLVSIGSSVLRQV